MADRMTAAALAAIRQRSAEGYYSLADVRALVDEVERLRRVAFGELTDDEHLAAVDAAYGAIEKFAEGVGIPGDTIMLAQNLFAHGFEAARAALSGGGDTEP